MSSDKVQSKNSEPPVAESHQKKRNKRGDQKKIKAVVKSILIRNTKNDAAHSWGFSDAKKLSVPSKLFDRKRSVLTLPKPSSETEPTAFNIEKLNVLASIKVHLKIVGCMPIDEASLPRWCAKLPINHIHIGLVLLILLLNIFSTFWFYIRETETFIDFSESVFWASRSILSTVLYTMLIWRRSDFMKFISTLEEIVENREHSICFEKKKNSKLFCDTFE